MPDNIISDKLKIAFTTKLPFILSIRVYQTTNARIFQFLLNLQLVNFSYPGNSTGDLINV